MVTVDELGERLYRVKPTPSPTAADAEWLDAAVVADARDEVLVA